jgi:Putative zincin peptidase
MPLTLIDRFHPRLRQEQQAAIDAGQLLKREELELLEPEKLRTLALLSLYLLLIGGVFFVGLNIAAYIWQAQKTGGSISVVLWVVINIIGYIVILPIHELIHGMAFAFWGGKPYYGKKLPFALYCGAKNQLFRRNHYLVVGLAPLVVISLAGIIFTLVAPVLASYTLFATIGNVSGAAGDVWVARKILRYPKSVLVEDTETGYRVWELTSPQDTNLT